jgi:hypothetical protein
MEIIMAINKLSTIPKHLLDPSIMPPNAVTYPGSGVFSAPGGSITTHVTTPNINTKDYAIQGQMLTVEKVLNSYELERTGLSANIKNFEDEIKKELIQKLLHEIVRQRCIEFTSQKDMLTNSVVYRARIYVTPDEQTRIIRQIQK